MRQWPHSPETDAQINPLVGVRTGAIADLGQRHFQHTLHHTGYHLLPAASRLLFITGPLCESVICLSAALTRRVAQIRACILPRLSSHDMAFEMTLSVNTANTYRNHAFHRLSIHFRNMLFAQVLTSTQRVAAC